MIQQDEIVMHREYETLIKRQVGQRLYSHEPVEQLGVRVGLALPASVVEDERLLAVLRHHVGADADDHELVWREPECLRA
ncbi:hypothetical protein K7G98_42250, partial [Saccharothrix sp. MB29]|nr:hypothetical protein [Saccharothrix sp. MB29]